MPRLENSASRKRERGKSRSIREWHQVDAKTQNKNDPGTYFLKEKADWKEMGNS